MNLSNLKIVTVPLEDMAAIIREIVASGLQKINILTNPIKQEDSDELLSRAEVCKLLKVSFTTLFHWNNSNILTHNKIGTRVYYKRAEVMNKLNRAA